MRLGIAGPHGSGKSTLLNLLRDAKELESLEFITEVTRNLAAAGFKINEEGNLDTQVILVSTHVTTLLTRDNFLTDRTLLDVCTYSEFLHAEKKIPSWFIDYTSQLMDHYLGNYDKIIYVPQEIPLVDDGVRSQDDHFHREMVRLFAENVEWYGREFPGLFLEVHGSPEERAEQVLKEIRALSL